MRWSRLTGTVAPSLAWAAAVVDRRPGRAWRGRRLPRAGAAGHGFGLGGTANVRFGDLAGRSCAFDRRQIDAQFLRHLLRTRRDHDLAHRLGRLRLGPPGAEWSLASGPPASASAPAARPMPPVSFSTKLIGTCSSFSPSTIRGDPTGSVWLFWTRRYFTKPPAGDSISSVALSVSISKITSPFLTSSPTFTRQLTTVPSSIVWPIFGRLISFAIDVRPHPFRFTIQD